MKSTVRFALAVLACLPAVAAAQRPLALTKAEAEFADPFTDIRGVRELKDGRILVADARDKTLQLVDLKSGSATKVGREGQGPGEYALPFRLIPLPGDSTAVYDAGNQRYLTVHPDGKTGKDFRLEADRPAAPSEGAGGRGGRGGMMMSIAVPRGVDAKGNIYYQGPAFAMSPEGELQSSDSAPVLRFDRAARRIDTVAYTKLAKSNTQVAGGRGNMEIRIGGGNPLAPQDDWAVLPDGKVAVVRVADYHVDYYASLRSRTSGAPVPYEKIRVDAAVKKMVEDQRARAQRSGITMTFGGGRGGESRQTQVGGGRGNDAPPPLTDWPDVMPAFQQNAAWARPNGEVWVLRTRKPGDEVPVYDVFDAAGRVIGKVALPVKSRLIGFGQGTVYLIRLDDDDLQYLQRYRLPMDAKLTG